MNIAYWGPDIRIPVPQPALNVNMDAHTNVESLSFSLDGLAKKIVVLTVLDPVTQKIPIPIPVPNISVAAAAARRAADAAGEGRVRRRTARSSTVAEAVAARARRSRSTSSDAITGIGLARRAALRPRAAGRGMLVGVRGAGLAFDGLYYVKSVTHNIKRGEYKQSFTLSRDGLISHHTEGACHERTSRQQAVLRQVPRHGDQQRRPDAARPAAGAGARRARAACPRAGPMPCVPLAGPTGPPMGVYLVPPIGAGVWVEFEQGDPDYPIWVGLPLGRGRRTCRRWRWRACRSRPSIVLQTAGQNTHRRSATCPGPTGGSCSRALTGAMIVVNDTGIYISERQGRDDRDDRARRSPSTTAR